MGVIPVGAPGSIGSRIGGEVRTWYDVFLMIGDNKYTHIYLSPHLDDAVLSCAGRIRQQVVAGQRPAVVTVFAGVPDSRVPLSPYARDLHARWSGHSEAVKKRRKEDRQALALLGAEAVRWDYRDCIYRRTPDGQYAYASEEALWGPLDPYDASLVRELAGRLDDLPLQPDGSLYAPLGIGRHVDHRIVRAAVRECGRSRIYYEDFPYAADPEAVEASDWPANLEPDSWEAELVPLSSEDLERKMAAIACYRSQVSTFWAGDAQMASSVRAFAERVGAGTPAERYWRCAEGRRKK